MTRRRLHARADDGGRESSGPFIWINVPAIVAVNEDQENMHRIKCIIPAMNDDENPDEVYDEWITQLSPYAGSAGYGDFAVPAVGSEVRLFGEFGQGDNLAYLCVYNENNPVPGDSNDETARVIRAPGDLKIIARGDVVIEGGRVLMQSRFGTTQIKAAAGLITNPEDES